MRQRKQKKPARKAARTRRPLGSEDRKLVTGPGGFSAVLHRVEPVQILRVFDPKYKGWEQEKIDGGWRLYKPGTDQEEILTHEGYGKFMDATSARIKASFKGLSREELDFAGPLEEFRRVKGGLQKPFWKELNRLSLKTYLNLVRSIALDAHHQADIEEVEGILRKHGISWARLRTIKPISEPPLYIAQESQERADKMIKEHTAKWRRWDPAVKQISSPESPFSEEMKKRLAREHRRVRSLTPYDKTIIKALRGNLAVAVREILGGYPTPVDRRIKYPFTRMHLWNLVIIGLVAELMSAGLSKRKSFILTDRMLHLICPRAWPEPTEFSPDLVRQRYYYSVRRVRA